MTDTILFIVVAIVCECGAGYNLHAILSGSHDFLTCAAFCVCFVAGLVVMLYAYLNMMRSGIRNTILEICKNIDRNIEAIKHPASTSDSDNSNNSY